MNPTPDHHAPLRDARLARALEHAPDTLEPNQPASALRDAILRAAHEAVAVPPPHPAARFGGWAALGSVWNRWMGGRMPWNAALATVLLAGFITLLWREEPVPPAQTDLPIPSATAPAAPAEPAVPAVQENVQKEEKKAPAEPSSNPAADRAADRAAAARQRESLASRPAAPRDNAAPAPAAPSAPAAPAAAPPSMRSRPGPRLLPWPPHPPGRKNHLPPAARRRLPVCRRTGRHYAVPTAQCYPGLPPVYCRVCWNPCPPQLCHRPTLWGLPRRKMLPRRRCVPSCCGTASHWGPWRWTGGAGVLCRSRAVALAPDRVCWVRMRPGHSSLRWSAQGLRSG